MFFNHACVEEIDECVERFVGFKDAIGGDEHVFFVEQREEKSDFVACSVFGVDEFFDFFEHKGKGYELLELRLETGRTHQIRVHLAHLGRPVVGDVVYGLAGVNKDFGFLSGQCLHSRLVEFAHPVSGERIRVESELPEHFKRVLEILGDKYGV